jgi:arsenate reductase-like glutaredoxin family protein
MKTSIFEIEDKVKQLLVVLDRDIENILQNLTRLNDLRSFVVKRDEVSLQKMLASIQTQSNNFKDNDAQRKTIREELADIMNCEFSKVTLSALENELSGDLKREVNERKIRLKTLASQFRKEHISTSKLLAECARFNGMLLRSILELGHARTITYNPQGITERQSNSAIMNMEF